MFPALRSRLPASHNIFGDYVLAFHRHLRLRLRCRLAPLHSQSATSVCFSGSSMPLRCTPSCTRRLSSIFTFHPPDRGVCHCYHPPAHLFYAHPGPRCAVRRCTDSTPATKATAALTSSSLRLTARRGRLIVLVQSHDKEPVVPQVTRHPSVLFAPSSLRSLSLVHLHYAPHRHHRTSPHLKYYAPFHH